GIGAVQVWFNWGADINVGQMEVMQRVTQILNNLPPGILQPFIVKFDVSNIPAAFVTVSGGNLDERGLYDLAFNTIAPQIEQLPNVAAATVEVVDALRRALPRMIGIPPGVKLGISFDQSVYIRQSIKNLIDQAIEGSVLAAAVILVFLRSVTSTLIISVAIPLSVLVTFITLYFTGQTLNIMTMGGLALGIGRLVDDSIVELENIQRHLNIGQSRWEAVLEAAREVAMPIFASTVTTVIVFLPIFFLVGIAKLLFIPLVFTITIALFTSFFVSRTVTPALCYKFVKPEHEAIRSLPAWLARFFEWSRDQYERLDAGYQELLAWALTHRRTLIVTVVLVFFGSLALVPLIGSEFIPVTDESQFRIFVRAPVGQRVGKPEQQVAEIERVLRETIKPSELDTVVSSIG